ncbi:putative ribonuclease H-like domain, reverse transcriptase zinc-binding domain-containing protein [Rosa chinensis]|uniref:Putative ribonuclease H-like domain, reverse transcriptase zinc-binding domain-containing protein n=1 Tax=Rosa chinensis TaxID=74649 RepID=A0A2P6SEI1_ROSCH|nr:putative ribonuclease H-like domain, reverse transcriptase zinc-binding domain-containing protein [Rosa chinensis]
MREIFTEGEVEKIACIPLSLHGRVDRLIWHYDRKGLYSVRSGYHVFNNFMCRKDKASTSLNGCGRVEHNYWMALWGARVPPKVKSFVWRLLHGILPTKSSLVRRKIRVEDPQCLFCKGDLETDARLHPAGNVVDWIMEMMDFLTVDQRDYFFMGLWAIWTERNNILWKGVSFQPMNLVQWTSSLLEDYQKYHPKAVKKKGRPKVKWQCPPSGRLKINVDGAFCLEDGRGGIGVVVRDDSGKGIAALARPFVHAHSILHMEAEACRAGLLLGIYQGWADVDIESDSAILIAALKSEEKNFSEVSRVLDDCKEYFNAFQSIRVRHIYREANGVANRLAHLASSVYFDDVWLGETPAIIQDVLYEDYCHCLSVTRGLGDTSPPMHNFTINIINGTGRGAEPPS